MIECNANKLQEQFNRLFKDYLKLTKRACVDSLNTKTYFIAANAANATVKADPNKIRNDILRQVKGTANVGSLVINKKRGEKGQKGYFGQRMQMEIEKLIKRRQRLSGYIAKGWLRGLNIFKPVTKDKSKVKIMIKGGEIKGKYAGGGKPANANTQGFNLRATLYNDVGKKSQKVYQLLMEGLTKGFAQEMASMKEYISNKIDKMLKEMTHKRY